MNGDGDIPRETSPKILCDCKLAVSRKRK